MPRQRSQRSSHSYLQRQHFFLFPYPSHSLSEPHSPSHLLHPILFFLHLLSFHIFSRHARHILPLRLSPLHFPQRFSPLFLHLFHQSAVKSPPSSQSPAHPSSPLTFPLHLFYRLFS